MDGTGVGLRIGVVGAGGRGGSFKNALAVLDATVQAVCDVDAAKAESAQAELGAVHAFTDYSSMLQSGDVQAVVVGTPMHLHVAQSIEALEKGIHVLCEVTAGVSVEECRQLVQAAANSGAVYMLAENLNYDRTNVVSSTTRSSIFDEHVNLSGTAASSCNLPKVREYAAAGGEWSCGRGEAGASVLR